MAVTRLDSGLPIDRGYAWVIVAAGTSLFSLAVGGLKCQGVILVELLDRFDGLYDASTILWIFAVYSVVGAFCGPAVSWCIVKLSFRRTSLLGVLMTACSNIALGYLTSLPLMIVFYSFIGGFGMRMLISCCQLGSAQYFVKRRALAVGIVTSGSGVGTVAIPYLLRLLFDHFDYSGAMLLYAGFHLQFLCIAAFLRPISYYKNSPSQDQKVLLRSMNSSNTPDTCEDEDIAEKMPLSEESTQRMSKNSIDSSQGAEEAITRHRSNDNLPSSSDESAKLNEDLKLGGERVAKPNSYNLRVVFIPQFQAFCATIMTYMFGYAVVYQTAPALAKQCNVDKSTVAIVMIVAGILEVPFRIANGVLVDKKVLTAVKQIILTMFITGALNLVCAIVSGLPGITIVLLAMSSTGSSFYTLMPFVLRELVGPDDVTVALGIQNMCQSVGMAGATLIAGVIYNGTKDWLMVYYYTSSIMIFSSIIFMSYFGIARLMARCSQTTVSSVTNSP